MDSSDALIARFLALHPKTIDLSLGRIQRLLGQLGHPERRLPPTIHVAGTNGKGSTIAFMRAILESAGLARPCLYLAPSRALPRAHPARADRRRALCDEETARRGLPALRGGECGRADHRVRDHDRGRPAALLRGACRRAPARGRPRRAASTPPTSSTARPPPSSRPSATTTRNISAPRSRPSPARRPASSSAAARPSSRRRITSRPTRPCAPRPSASAPRRSSSASRISPCTRKADASSTRTRTVSSTCRAQDSSGGINTSMPGTAIAALRAAGFEQFETSAFEAGVTRAEWPGRLQRLDRGRLPEIAPKGCEIWLDGGHNPDGGRVLAAAMADQSERRDAPLVLIAGMLGTKDQPGLLQEFRRPRPRGDRRADRRPDRCAPGRRGRRPSRPASGSPPRPRRASNRRSRRSTTTSGTARPAC